MKNIFYFMIIFLFISCEKQIRNEVFIEPSVEINTVSSTPKVNVWDATDVKLPKGRVIKMDFAHGKGENPENDHENNYVTIRLPNNKLQIIRDIDVDTYLNLNIGDIIE